VTIVLDHCGGPLGVGPFAGRRDEVFRAWRADMLTLAACPNVVVKLGGLAMRVGGHDFDRAPLPPASERLATTWRPVIETCIELFGATRCMFESNFPVDKGMCAYPVLWNAFKRLTAGASGDDKAALFAGTAARVYRLLDLPEGIAPDLSSRPAQYP
jgi:predicted TIM-barrel fold metal-dependent hydrolase